MFLPLVTPGTVVGRVGREASRKSGLAEGTLLVCSTGDQQAAAIGAAVIDEGRASLTLGTAGLLVAGTRQSELSKSPGLMAVSSGRVGLYELEGIQLGAASCYRWIRDLFFDPGVSGIERSAWPENLYHRMERLLNDSRPGANGIVFLPYLAGDVVEVKKPDPAIYLLALERTGLRPEECVVVEDSRVGTLAGRAAGCRVLATVNEYTRGEDMSAADAVLTSLGEPDEPAELLAGPAGFPFQGCIDLAALRTLIGR